MICIFFVCAWYGLFIYVSVICLIRYVLCGCVHSVDGSLKLRVWYDRFIHVFVDVICSFHSRFSLVLIHDTGNYITFFFVIRSIHSHFSV